MSDNNTDREALDQCIRDADGYWPQARENIIAAGFRRQPEAVTDDKVEAAAMAIVDSLYPGSSRVFAADRDAARAALIAASQTGGQDA